LVHVCTAADPRQEAGDQYPREPESCFHTPYPPHSVFDRPRRIAPGLPLVKSTPPPWPLGV
jgi:hypothetical protein